MRNVKVVGIAGSVGFSAIVDHFVSLGGDVVLFNPDMVCGEKHIISAARHAERALNEGHNRSRNILTETILYAAGERQIGKAMKKTKPDEDRGEYVACIFDLEDLKLDELGMIRKDSLFEASEEKLTNLGLKPEDGISPEQLAMELVAMTDILKQ